MFSRKYGTSCNTCHIAIPKLNKFGLAYKMNGYFWPGSLSGTKENQKFKPKKSQIWKKVLDFFTKSFVLGKSPSDELTVQQRYIELRKAYKALPKASKERKAAYKKSEMIT